MEGLALVIITACLGQDMSLVHKLAIIFAVFDLRGIEGQTPIQPRRCSFPNRHKYLHMTNELIPNLSR